MISKKVSTITGVIVIIIISAVVGVSILKFKNNSTIDNQLQDEVKTNTPKEVGSGLDNISTKDWKIFVNEKDGYSIKYPSTWNYKTKYGQEEGLFIYSNDYKIDQKDNNFENLNGDYFVTVSVNKNLGYTDIYQWRKCSTVNCKEVSIKGNKALQFNADNLSGQVRRYDFIRNNYGYEITINYKDTANDIGEKIISTLEFLN